MQFEYLNSTKITIDCSLYMYESIKTTYACTFPFYTSRIGIVFLFWLGSSRLDGNHYKCILQKHGSMAVSRHPKHPSPTTINSCTAAGYYIMGLLKYTIVLACGIRTKNVHCFTVINTRVHDDLRFFNALFLIIIIIVHQYWNRFFFSASFHVGRWLLYYAELNTGKGNSSLGCNKSIK